MNRILMSVFLTSSLLTGLMTATDVRASAIDSKHLKIQSAYQNGNGDLLVQFEPDAKRFPAQDNFFFGKADSLQQIEQIWNSPAESGSRIQFGDGEVSVENGQASVSCGDGQARFMRLSDGAISRLQNRLKNGKTAIKMLPEVQETAFLLQVQGTRDFVYVTAPRFNFHENYEVYIGPLGRWKKIKTIETPKDPTWNQAGLIRFKDGGGVYIPAAIDLFVSKPRDRGAPTLVRTANGKIEPLARPTLSRADLRKAHLDPITEIHVASPCDYASQLAQVSR